MIRLALMTIGFIAVTIALLVFQPGGNRRAGPDSVAGPAVTRSGPAPAAAPTSASVQFVPRMAHDTPIQALPAQPPAASGGAIDDESLRRMTWSTLSNLNTATGRESAPGQPGSLLYTIVRRSLDETPTGTAPSARPVPNNLYVVQPGDSLVTIAERLYGDVNMTGPLFAANQDLLTRPDDLRAGQTLVLPNR